MSTTTRIRCGGCQGSHETIAEVKSCCLGIGAVEEELGFEKEIQRREREESERVTRFKVQRDEPLKDGVYRNPQTGEIFKLYHTVHGANQLVAKELVSVDPYEKSVRGKLVTIRAEFIYRGKAPLRSLTASMQMTLEEAKKYGALYGTCVRCGLPLTAEVSIERAMGPVCCRKANWA